MAISAKLVKELRDKTGAGLMDCKKALVKNDGDLDKAVDWLREKGVSQAEKKASRVAAEGMAEVKVDGNKAIIFELNCETDFVAKNDNFKALVNKIGDALIKTDKKDTESALAVEVDAKKLQDLLLEQTTTIGEKLTFRRYTMIEKTADQIFGSYVHMGGSIASLVVLNEGDKETARNIAMHIAASNPIYISRDDISDEYIEHEKKVLTNQALNENAESDKPKPENIIEKMVIGRLNKNFKEICLLSQPYVKNPDENVKNYLKSQGASIALFKRLAVGEDIEKKEENFAEEVRKQSS